MSDNLSWTFTVTPEENANKDSLCMSTDSYSVASGIQGTIILNHDSIQPLSTDSDNGRTVSLNSEIDNSNISNIRSIMSFIYNEFGNVPAKAYNLNCFFYLEKDGLKTCFHFLKSLPIFRLSFAKNNSNSISFSSDWNGNPKEFDGWDAIETQNIESKQSITHKAKSTFVIPEVTKISVYKWGFEITNDASSVQLIAIMPYALEKKQEPLLGKPGWEPAFNHELMKSDPDFMTPTAEWRKNNEG
jgi:hypothetical protein